MFENFPDHCRAEWKSSPARAVAGESSACSIVYCYFEQLQVTDVLRLGKGPDLERGTSVKNADPGTGPHSFGLSSRNRLMMKGHTTRYVLILSLTDS
jgi:hypothetical protein